VRTFFQEGLEKSTEKGSRIDKMLRNREFISAYCFVFDAKEYAQMESSLSTFFLLDLTINER
jgi:hypothetical protein